MTNRISDNKRERFKRLGEYRTNEVLKKLKVLGNCANRSAYEYNEVEVNNIFSAIEKMTKQIRAKFYYSQSNKKFSL